jgi:fructoselysine-6-P-deglycase FrlB-like protein
MSSIALNTGALAATLASRTAANEQLSEVFLVGCGASLADLYPAKFLLSGQAGRLRTDAYTANEFVHATPRALGKCSVVILCSHSGGTREVVAAAKLARAAGALTVTLTHNKAAKIAEYSDHAILYEWGDDSRVEDNPMLIALALCAEILQQTEGYPHYDDIRTAIQQIDDMVMAARTKVAPQAESFAKTFQNEKLFYVLSSGASYAHAYAFAICSLMEMQWLNASAIHSGEFFHGPFEITDSDTNFIVLMNEGRTRPLDQRVLAFLQEHAVKYEVIDARELGIGVLPDTVVEYFNPVLFYSVLSDYRAALAKIRNHPLDTRRYMGKVTY